MQNVQQECYLRVGHFCHTFSPAHKIAAGFCHRCVLHAVDCGEMLTHDNLPTCLRASHYQDTQCHRCLKCVERQHMSWWSCVGIPLQIIPCNMLLQRAFAMLGGGGTLCKSPLCKSIATLCSHLGNAFHTSNTRIGLWPCACLINIQQISPCPQTRPLVLLNLLPPPWD